MAVNRDQKVESLSQMLTVREVANLLHVHPNTVRRWSDMGLLRAHRLGYRCDRRYRVDDIEVFIAGSSEERRGPQE
jgi:excisionase family DNA binding protein